MAANTYNPPRSRYVTDDLITPVSKHLRPYNVHILCAVVYLEGTPYPTIPSQQALIFVDPKGRFFTEDGLAAHIKGQEYFQQIVGYALVHEGAIHRYTNDPNNETLLEEYTNFVSQVEEARSRMSNPPPAPPASVPELQTAYTGQTPDYRTLMMAVCGVVLLSQVLQVFIALIK